MEIRPQKAAGLIVIAGAITLLTMGMLASEFFLTRLSLVIAVAGMVLFFFGRSHLRCFAFPIAFLLLDDSDSRRSSSTRLPSHCSCWPRVSAKRSLQPPAYLY